MVASVELTNEDIVINTAVALMQAEFNDSPRLGYLLRALTVLDYMGTLGLKVTWKNEDH